MQEGCIYWGEGKKFYVVTKRVKKKIHFCLVWGFSNHLSNEGGLMGWVFIVIPLLICFLKIHCIGY